MANADIQSLITRISQAQDSDTEQALLQDLYALLRKEFAPSPGNLATKPRSESPERKPRSSPGIRVIDPNGHHDVIGRGVGFTVDDRGHLLITDEHGKVFYRRAAGFWAEAKVMKAGSR